MWLLHRGCVVGESVLSSPRGRKGAPSGVSRGAGEAATGARARARGGQFRALGAPPAPNEQVRVRLSSSAHGSRPVASSIVHDELEGELARGPLPLLRPWPEKL